MECNKEEAIRAKDIAETKMQNKDFVGARKIVLKAQQLHPDLENISQMLTVCEVHCSAGLKVNGEMDWYGILQVEATADESLIKKQYRKLALLLHPDKNKFAGAEAAFKLIGEAHMTLSDKGKRSLHDIKRNANIKTAQPRQPFQPSKKASYARNNLNTTGYNGSTQQQQQQPSSFFTGAQTFWTICPFCGMKYQYYRSILNRALRCQSCMKPFIAYDLNVQGVPTGANSGHSWNNSGTPQQRFPGQPAHNATQHSQFGNPSSGTGMGNVGGVSGINSVHGSGPANKAEDGKVNVEAGAGNEVKFEKVKLSEGNKSEQVLKPSVVKTSQKKGRKVVVDSSDTDSTDSEDVVIKEKGPGMQDSVTTSSRYPRRSTRHKQNVTYNENESEDDDDLTNPPSFKRPRKDGSSDCTAQSDKDEGVKGVNVKMSGNNVAKDKVGNEQSKGFPHVGLANDNEQQNQDRMHEDKQKATEGEEKSCANNYPAVDTSSNTSPNLNSFSYPDPEFFDFEKYRQANHFAVGQIWAVYDDLDGMPRFYCRIRSVSAQDFKLRFTWLEHVPSDEVEEAWASGELPVGCGNFRLGDSEHAHDLLMFSHIISWKKGKKRNTYDIYPRKGEVWALYKGWSITWSSDADNHRLYEYEVVEVCSDFTSGAGIVVVPLVRIKGFVSLFMHAKDMGSASFVIPANEILRFSHHIPSYRLNGTEKEGVPAGCVELDSASLPMNFKETFPSVSLNDCTSRDTKLDDGCIGFKPVTETEKPVTSTVQGTENIRANDISSEGANVVSKKEQSSTSQHEATGAWNHVKGEAEAQENNENGDGDSCGNDASESAECDDSSSQPHTFPTCGYPESEFHNFEEGRSAGKFEHGQVWALYSDIDKYPKYYALITSVRLKHFEVHLQWLEACGRREKRWVRDELPVGCGLFRVATNSEPTSMKTVETFSHLVQAMPAGKKNQYEILPSNGEIWAVYKNWNIEWTLSDVENCEYDVVKICEPTSSGVNVLLLTKVDGYCAVFRSERSTMEIPKDEYLRFSHQIPAFKLTDERGGKLRGYWELDPASVPEIFLS